MKEKIKEKIIELVKNNCPIKAVELALETSVWVHENKMKLETKDYYEYLSELQNSGDIIEVSYVLSDSDYKERSIYFPKGTQIEVLTY